MLAFRNLAKSTFGEIKGALVEEDDDEDEDEGDAEQTHTPHGASPLPPAFAVAPPPVQPSLGLLATLGAKSAEMLAEATAKSAEMLVGDVGPLPTTGAHTPSTASSIMIETAAPAVVQPPVAAAPSPLPEAVVVATASDSPDASGATATTSTVVEAPSEPPAATQPPVALPLTALPPQSAPLVPAPSGEQPATVEAPRLRAAEVLATDAGGSDDRGRLLACFSERYDSLLAEFDALQQRHREAAQWEGTTRRLQQEVSAWQAAHEASTARVEELTVLNAELTARIRALENGSADPLEKRQLLDKLAQREAEVRAAGDAMQQLQSVLEEGAGDSDARSAELERQLKEARRAAAAAEAERAAEASGAQEAREAAAAAAAREQPLMAKCNAAERELRESLAALEVLLQEKGRHLDEREHHVDRRLVTSMLALYLDHLDSGQSSLAEQVIRQTMQILGADSAQEERQRIKAAAAAAEARLAEPLGDAFLDFLNKEATTEGGAAPLPERQGAR